MKGCRPDIAKMNTASWGGMDDGDDNVNLRQYEQEAVHSYDYSSVMETSVLCSKYGDTTYYILQLCTAFSEF